MMRRLHAESGLTLVEMMVVMLVMSAILAFTLGSFASFQQSASGAMYRVENLNEGRVLMQVITKDIRTAAKLSAATPPFPDVAPYDGITQADDNEVVFFANLNQSTQCPKIIRLYVDGVDKIIESVTEPNLGAVAPCVYPDMYPSTPTRTRLVGRYVANEPDEPIFTYYTTDATGALVAFTVDQTPLTVENALLVKAVGIELAIRKETSLVVDHTTLENRVRLPNVFYNPPPSPSPTA